MAAIQNLFNLPFGNYPRRDIYRIPLILPIPKFRVPIKVTNGLSSSLQSKTHKILHQFDPNIPLEEAATPPSSWYFDPSFYSLELDHVFYAGWQVVGCIDQIKDAQDYFTGSDCRLGNVEYVICRDDDGEIHGFHNVCRHHASVLAYGSGRKTCFVCPYHGWTYGLKGNLLKAPRITGIQKFDPKEFGLKPICVATWGPFVVINVGSSEKKVDCATLEKQWLGSSAGFLSANGVDTSLSYICRREYTIECNWKVFCDNYLDGGYHVPYAHKELASGLNLDTYSTEDDKAFIQRSLNDSEAVQIEDIMLCEGVQRGLESPAYETGRYAPTFEKPMHQFHCLLHSSLIERPIVA
ncbi:choline monooxygenase, chloroplastic-like isoform X3 [Amaranthus tricolor]|uniref:choline monooxygenase, chloroplastic-like isoform X3 n=1 Tax=Amaranthus tricolor TaxID=29722 RepID=UPI002582F403|nr:choline monooxygenase, chloroplastic-like isoform X3 [Amaranthus tricolor]